MLDWIRRALTKRVFKQQSVSRAVRMEEVPPSEKLVIGIIFAIVALIGLIALQIAYLVVLKEWNSEVFAAITGLIGTIVGLFVGSKT